MSAENELYYEFIKNNSVELAKRLIVDLIWKEANIEGVDVTFPETQDIFDGRNVSRLTINELIIVNNLKHAWNYVLTNMQSNVTSINFINNINMEVGKNLFDNCGKIRSINVSIGGTKWKPSIPNEYVIEDRINELLQKYNKEELAIELGCYIMRQQFYPDGNKRTAQLVMNTLLIKNDLGIISISDDKKNEFFNLLLRYYETDNISNIKEFLFGCIIKE